MSVCIVHRDGWAVTDSRANTGHVGIGPVKIKKAFKSSGSLICTTGDAIILQKLEFLMQNRTMLEIVDAVSEWMFDNCKDSVSGSVLVVNLNRQLVYIDSNGHILPIEEQDFWAIGCAADRVLGYLDACLEKGEVIDPTVAEKAVKRAARFDSGIDDRTQTVWIER